VSFRSPAATRRARMHLAHFAGFSPGVAESPLRWHTALLHPFGKISLTTSAGIAKTGTLALATPSGLGWTPGIIATRSPAPPGNSPIFQIKDADVPARITRWVFSFPYVSEVRRKYCCAHDVWQALHTRLLQKDETPLPLHLGSLIAKGRFRLASFG
jgi:hypothetical protein